MEVYFLIAFLSGMTAGVTTMYFRMRQLGYLTPEEAEEKSRRSLVLHLDKIVQATRGEWAEHMPISKNADSFALREVAKLYGRRNRFRGEKSKDGKPRARVVR